MGFCGGIIKRFDVGVRVWTMAAVSAFAAGRIGKEKMVIRILYLGVLGLQFNSFLIRHVLSYVFQTLILCFIFSRVIRNRSRIA